MERTAAIMKAIDMLRAAGEDAEADELVGQLDDEEPETVVVVEPPVEPIIVVEPPAPPAPEPIADVVAAEGAAAVAVIEAQSEANIAEMEAAAAILAEEQRLSSERAAEETAALVKALDSQDPDPRSGHFFYRPRGRRK